MPFGRFFYTPYPKSSYIITPHATLTSYLLSFFTDLPFKSCNIITALAIHPFCLYTTTSLKLYCPVDSPDGFFPILVTHFSVAHDLPRAALYPRFQFVFVCWPLKSIPNIPASFPFQVTALRYYKLLIQIPFPFSFLYFFLPDLTISFKHLISIRRIWKTLFQILELLISWKRFSFCACLVYLLNFNYSSLSNLLHVCLQGNYNHLKLDNFTSLLSDCGEFWLFVFLMLVFLRFSVCACLVYLLILCYSWLFVCFVLI